MKDWVIHKFKSIFGEHKKMDVTFIFEVGVILTGSVHVLLIVLFGCMHVWPAFVLNIFSVLWYALTEYVIIKRKFILAFYMTFAEVLIHTVVVTYFCGVASLFVIYNLLLVPWAFYMSYYMEGFWQKYGRPLFLCCLAFLEIVVVYIFAKRAEIQYRLTDGQTEFFYIFNCFIAFITLTVIVMCFVVEISEQQNKLEEKNKELEQLANYDSLTGLQNRRSMLRCIRQNENKEFVLVLSDIDDFKIVNDTYGHECGDIVLCAVADTIQKNCSETSFCARWGGEEFLMLFQGDVQNAVKIADRIRQQIEEKVIPYEKRMVHCTMTFGVTAHRMGEEIEKTIARSDERLYLGKKNGKNCVVYRE